MHLVTQKKSPGSLPEETLQHLLDDLPPALKTPDNLALLKAYFLIPQPTVRHFVLVLIARITGNTDNAHPLGALPEAEYLLTQYAQLPTRDMRDKVVAMVRQVSVVNRGDI